MGKKTFSNSIRSEEISPAMQFISKPESTEQPKKTTDAPEGYKVNPLYIELKSRRLQLLLQPSLHEKIKKQAAAEGISVNEFVHSTLEEKLRGQ